MNNNLIKQINWLELSLACLLFLPILVSYAITHQTLLLNLSLVTLSLFIPISRIKSGAYVAIIQFVLIGICFSSLYFAFSTPWLFILLCGLMAFATLFVTRYGIYLRTVANFIFIPAVYLTCELRENLHPDEILAVYSQFMGLLPIALFSILILLGVIRLFNNLNQPIVSFGEIKKNWMREGIAILFSVMAAASYVTFMHVDHGEWMIWSTAAVIAGDFLSSKIKAKDRLIGLLSGIPVGLIIAQYLPKTAFSYSIAVLAIMLTLIAFKNYRVAFASRCCFIAIASYIATSTPTIAFERVENVILGGVMGLVTLSICHQLLFFKKMKC